MNATGIKVNIMLTTALMFAAIAIMFSSCGGDEPNPDEEDKDVERVTVLYAVNRSSLASDFSTDLREIESAMQNVDADRERFIIYRTDSESETALYEWSVDKNGEGFWKKVKGYSRNVTSTDPGRMSLVLDDAVALYPGVPKSLFFWGHGSAWTPEFSDHLTRGGENGPEAVDAPLMYGYGGEYGKDNQWQWADIDEIADAIPAGEFDTIWFDCCYMSSIEVAYQLRDKARWLVAYPTEVWDRGLNYDKVLPMVMRSAPDLIGGAETFFDYYDNGGDPVTVTVMDLSYIEDVAEAVREVISGTDNGVLDPAAGVVNYRRSRKTPYYDMLQLIDKSRNAEGADKVKRAMDRFVKYHAESARDFNNRAWSDPDLCGVSMHHYRGLDTDEEKYYETLDWFNAIH